MDEGIRSRDEEQRRAIYENLPVDTVDTRRHSTSDNGSIEHSPPDPCPGSTPSASYDDRYEQSMKRLKENIMQEINRDVTKPITELLFKVLLHLEEIRNGKGFPDNQSHEETSEIGDLHNEEQKNTLTESPDLTQVKENQANVTARQDKTVIIEGQNHRGTEDNPKAQDSHTNRKSLDYDNNTIRARNIKDFRSNSLQTRVRSIAVPPRPRSAFFAKRVVFDERDCLSNALQFHIEDLVDGIVFHDSELPDCLLQEGCLTEDECSTVRKLRDRKDQIRILLSLIKGRDLRVLKGFLKHIGQHNPDVAEKISEKFEMNKRDGFRGKLCALCKLMKQFNVKHVADSLWSIQVISDGLYNQIIYSEAPVGVQNDLWTAVINSLGSMDKANIEAAHKRLIRALSCKNLFTHLAEGISDMLVKNHGILMCCCESTPSLPRRGSSWGATSSSESFSPASISFDCTSNDFASIEGTENGDIRERRQFESLDGMPSITEETHVPTSPTTTTCITLGSTTSLQENYPVSVFPKQLVLNCSFGPKELSAEHLNKPIVTNKPLRTIKPPMTVKKFDIKLNTEEKVLYDKSMSSQKVSNQNADSDRSDRSHEVDVLTGNKMGENEEDIILPLPEKKNKCCALPNRSQDHVTDSDRSDSTHEADILTGNKIGENEEDIILPLPEKKNKRCALPNRSQDHVADSDRSDSTHEVDILTGNKMGENEEDIIPPLPEKKNKRCALPNRSQDQVADSDRSDSTHEVVILTGNKMGENEEDFIPQLPEKKNRRCALFYIGQEEYFV